MSFFVKKIVESDDQLTQKISDGDKSAFEKLFFKYYYDLCSVAVKITKSSELSRDVVQDVFLKIWKMRSDLQFITSLKAYLYRSVWNQALNLREKQQSRDKLKEEFKEGIRTFFEEPENPFHSKERKDMAGHIWRIVGSMAEQRKMVFTLYHQHGLTYKEIATVMKISRKTVENHMGLALQEIRDGMRLKKSDR